MPTPFTPDPAPRPEVIPATAAGGYLVASLSRPGAYWFVTIDRGRLTCPCERGQAIAAEDGDLPSRRFCRHGRILVRWTAEQDRAQARPTAPFNASAFTD